MARYEYTIGKTLDLKQEQDRTLATPRLPSNLILKTMYLTFDLVYGFHRTLPKFLVLEILARYPYWAWEMASYKRLSCWFCRRTCPVTSRVEQLLWIAQLGRESQDNEQWHMLILADVIRKKGLRLGWVRHVAIPTLLAFVYSFLTKAIYFVRPEWSFAMNAAFESHAEREYMLLAKENPAWENEAVESVYFKYYPRQDSLCQLLRRIALDERDHMHHSLEAIERQKIFGQKQRTEGVSS